MRENAVIPLGAEKLVYMDLRDHAEGSEEIRDGHAWRVVYLPNLRLAGSGLLQRDLTRLAAKGLYRAVGHQSFGLVRMDREA